MGDVDFDLGATRQDGVPGDGGADFDFGQTVRGLAAGQRLFGRFVLRRVLGRGGMGVVWLAQDGVLEEQVALKFLPEMVHMDPVAAADMKRETARSRLLTHPNIVRVHDIHQDATTAAIAMEYVEGETLAAVRVEQPGMCLETWHIGPLMAPLCAALDYAHGTAKVVHRDLKPANLMVDAEWRIKIMDFGIAHSLVESRSRLSAGAGPISGTLVYMSPQQALGEMPSPADDIYALGATLYNLITGKPPFFAGDVLAQLREKVPPSMAQRRVELGVKGEGEIPMEWEAAVAACLEKDPARRPQNAAELLAMVEKRAAGRKAAPSAAHARPLARIEAVPAASEFRAPARIGWLRRAGLAAGLVLIGLIGGSIWLWPTLPHDEAKSRERRISVLLAEASSALAVKDLARGRVAIAEIQRLEPRNLGAMEYARRLESLENDGRQSFQPRRDAGILTNLAVVAGQQSKADPGMAEAAAHISAADQAEREGKWDVVLEELKAAHDLTKDPALMERMNRIHQRSLKP